MAALTTDQFTPVYTDGKCALTVLYALKNVTATDTVDLAGQFKVVKRAGLLSLTSSTVAAVATITGNTVLTIPAGPANDGVWLIAWGVAL